MSLNLIGYLTILLMIAGCAEKPAIQYKLKKTCNDHDRDTVCEYYPYVPRQYVPDRVLTNLGCIFKSGSIVEAKVMNKFCKKWQDQKEINIRDLREARQIELEKMRKREFRRNGFK